MKLKQVFVLLVCITAYFGCASQTGDAQKAIASKTININQNHIEEFYTVNINGCDEQLLIQSDNTRDNPILLYLHGGPGSSLMMYSYMYDAKLKENFIYVNWDMRGTALSYHEGMDTSKISEGQIADDAVVLIHYLQETFHKKKIYLIGHSFGSALGMYLVKIHPELFHAYIGIGQIMNNSESVKRTYVWLHSVLEKSGDTEGLARIEKDHFPYIDLVIKYGGHHNLSLNLDELMMQSPYYFDGYLDLLQKGKNFSATYVGKNKEAFGQPADLKETTVPLYFFEGVNDHVIACNPQLVVEYCDKVKAPVKKVIWFEHSAHFITIEEPEKFQNEVVNVLQEVGKKE
ncbi:MAG: alpha/beta hydrolase [Treponema sp.]|jgi:pimeloyl-ACP methyl ester carboxylesterase|nr:alpha/beta hydrolase [Treponema sp.]